jgi:hypothetical protein
MKSHIFQLQDESQNISGDAELKKYITSYYRALGWMGVVGRIFPR